MNARLTMAAHVLGMLAWSEREEKGAVTSDLLARSIGTNPVVVRRILAALSRAGLVETRRGAGGGVSLARRPDQITLREAYEAVREEQALLGTYAGEPNPRCPVAPHVAAVLTEVFTRAEGALLAQLDTVTVHQLASEIAARGRAACRKT